MKKTIAIVMSFAFIAFSLKMMAGDMQSCQGVKSLNVKIMINNPSLFPVDKNFDFDYGASQGYCHFSFYDVVHYLTGTGVFRTEEGCYDDKAKDLFNLASQELSSKNLLNGYIGAVKIKLYNNKELDIIVGACQANSNKFQYPKDYTSNGIPISYAFDSNSNTLTIGIGKKQNQANTSSKSDIKYL